MASEIPWRDSAGNLWQTSLSSDANGVEVSTDTLLKPVDPKNPPASPVMETIPEGIPSGLGLELPDDIGTKMLFSPKTNTPAFKSAHIYWRDADHNLWFAETYTDSSGFSWTTETLITAAKPGVPPAAPVVQR